MFTSSQTVFSTVLAYWHRLRDRKKYTFFLLMFFFFDQPCSRPCARLQRPSAAVSYWLLSFSALVWLAQRCVAHTAHVFSMWTDRRCFSLYMLPKCFPNLFARTSGYYGIFSVFLLSFWMRSSFFILWFIVSEYHWQHLWQECLLLLLYYCYTAG